MKRFTYTVLAGLISLLVTAFQVQAAEVVTYYHNDHLGSPIAATDGSGAVVWEQVYDPWGETLITSSDERSYTGNWKDPATGLSDHKARWHSTSIGRFMAIDPIGFHPSNVQSFNRYAYGNNNPYSLVDPGGQSPWLYFRKDLSNDQALLVNGISNQAKGVAVTGLYGGSAAAASLTPVGRRLLASLRGMNGEAEHPLTEANYAQKTYSEQFSNEGAFSGKSIDDVAASLRNGSLKPEDVPVDYIVRNNRTLIVNTRSAQALTRAGVPRSQWSAVNRTGQRAYEGRLSGQLRRNKLDENGITVPRSSGER